MAARPSDREAAGGGKNKEGEWKKKKENYGKRVAAGVGVAYFAHVAAVTDACSNLQQVGSEGSTKRSDSCSRSDSQVQDAERAICDTAGDRGLRVAEAVVRQTLSACSAG